MTEDDDREYIVLVNDDGQYSLWPTYKDVPVGWTVVGPRGLRTICLEYIEANWVDMRPKHLTEKPNQEPLTSDSKDDSVAIH